MDNIQFLPVGARWLERAVAAAVVSWPGRRRSSIFLAATELLIRREFCLGGEFTLRNN